MNKCLYNIEITFLKPGGNYKYIWSTNEKAVLLLHIAVKRMRKREREWEESEKRVWSHALVWQKYD